MDARPTVDGGALRGLASCGPIVVAAIANYGDRGVSLTVHAAKVALRQAVAFEFSVIVVDDGSDPKVVEKIRNSVPGLERVIHLPENRGYAAACNAAIRQARAAGADYVWLLNNDIDMPASTLAPLVKTLERQARWAAVAPVTIDPESPHRVLGAGMVVGRTRARVRHLYTGSLQRLLPAEPYAVDGIEGAAPLLRLAAVDVIGELDEGYGMYWEDTDWSVRARDAGWEVGIDPRARVSHLVGQSTSSERRTELLIWNRIRFADLTGTPVQRLVFRLYFVLGWLPLYTATRLVPRFGLRTGARMAARLLSRALRWTSAGEHVA